MWLSDGTLAFQNQWNSVNSGTVANTAEVLNCTEGFFKRQRHCQINIVWCLKDLWFIFEHLSFHFVFTFFICLRLWMTEEPMNDFKFLVLCHQISKKWGTIHLCSLSKWGHSVTEGSCMREINVHWGNWYWASQFLEVNDSIYKGSFCIKSFYEVVVKELSRIVGLCRKTVMAYNINLFPVVEKNCFFLQ